MMNNRIRELMVEAKEQTTEGKWRAPTAVWAEVFAQLIVQECLNQLNNGFVDEDSFRAEEDIEARCYLNGKNGALHAAASRIKSHFGVK